MTNAGKWNLDEETQKLFDREGKLYEIMEALEFAHAAGRSETVAELEKLVGQWRMIQNASDDAERKAMARDCADDLQALIDRVKGGTL